MGFFVVRWVGIDRIWFGPGNRGGWRGGSFLYLDIRVNGISRARFGLVFLFCYELSATGLFFPFFFAPISWRLMYRHKNHNLGRCVRSSNSSFLQLNSSKPPLLRENPLPPPLPRTTRTTT